MGVRYHTGTITRARELNEAGWTTAEIQRVLKHELGVDPSRQSILRWTDTRYADRVLEEVRRGNRRRWANQWTFRLGGTRMSPEYQAAFACRLRAEGEPVAGIARVCRVVFGGHWSSHRVRKLIAESDS